MKSNSIRSAKIFIGAFCAIGLWTVSAMAQASGDPNNNLTGSLGSQDPSTVIKCNGTYYVYGTNGGGNLVSKDRKQWSNGVSITKSQPWWSAHGGMMWAPDVSYMNGVYYCYYSVSASKNFESAIGLTTSPTLDPTALDYKWTDKGMVVDNSITTPNGGAVNNIDPSTIVDSDGKWYLAWGSWKTGLRLMELNTQTGMPKDNPPVITKIVQTSGEGSAACHYKNYYFYALSRGTCCAGMNSTYYMCYGRASNVKGPYLTKNGSSFLNNVVEVLLKGTNSSTTKTGAVAVGVGGFFWDGANGLDTLFIDYMAYTAPNGGPLLNIHPLYIDATGWLTFDPTQGTIMTRATSSKSINPKEIAAGQSFKNPVSVHILNATDKSPVSKLSALYTITGQKYFGNAAKAMPAGIYIEKNK